MKELIARFLFARLPLVGRVLLAAGGVLAVLSSQFPEYAILGDLNAYVLMIMGWLGLEAGVKHANKKDS